MAGFCKRCRRKIIDPEMVFNKFGAWHKVSYEKKLKLKNALKWVYVRNAIKRKEK